MAGSLNKNINFNFKEVFGKVRDKRPSGVPKEINLVPDIKDEMIKTLKLRNLIFFLCIVVASASLGATAIFASIAGGQQAVVDGKKSTIDNLSSKLSSYSDLSDFLTIRDQLSNVSSIADNKKLLSRIFGVLSALLPQNGDSIRISELNIDLTDESPAISFDAQADANNPPYIDYNVLDAFKKSMQYMRYDYGSYVDSEGAEIPAYCMLENGIDGATFSDIDKGIYAYWLVESDGCNPSGLKNLTTEEYEGQNVVRIWRTPQFADWYKAEPSDNKPYMTLSGEIGNVAHFESSCITYSGSENETNGKVSWTSTNESCLLVPDGQEGIVISDSSNGRSSDDELVLRFSAVIYLSPEIFSFSNKHAIAIGPTGRYNVTDSYVQIQDMFGERASDCASGDTACFNNTIGGN